MFGKKKKEKVKKQESSTKEQEGPLSERKIAARVEEGAVHAIITFELVGKPKTHVEKAIKEYIENIKKDSRITMISEESAEVIEQEDGMFSTFCEAEMLINEMSTLVWLAVNFSPASVEILAPDEKKVSAAEMNAWLNDLISKLHEVSFEFRNMNLKNKAMNASLNALINNFILSILEHDSLTADALQQKMGIHKDQLAPFLKHLLEQERITQKKGIYSIGKKG